MRAVKSIALILFLGAASAVGQDIGTPSAKLPTLAPGYTVDCATVFAVISCRSYNEMIENKDEDLLGAVKTPSLVCFRDDEDAFVVLAEIVPSPNLVYRETSKVVSETSGVVFYYRFKKGLNDDFRYVSGMWSKLNLGEAPSISFESSKGSDTKVSISPAELSVSYQYKNLGGSITSYSIQVRRSTKRFVETFQFPDEPAAPEKNKPAVPKRPGNTRMEYTGHCAEFPPAAQ